MTVEIGTLRPGSRFRFGTGLGVLVRKSPCSATIEIETGGRTRSFRSFDKKVGEFVDVTVPVARKRTTIALAAPVEVVE